MARPRFTLGRAFALLILGIGIGAGLFVFRHLRPDAVKQQVREALGNFFDADFDFADAVLDVDTGVELVDLRIYYDDDTIALRADRVALTVDHQELLSGDVKIRQVDITGLRLHLRPDPKREGLLGLPGVFGQMGTQARPKTQARPVVLVTPGRNGSFVELEGLPYLKPVEGSRIRLECLAAELAPDGPNYVFTGAFKGKRIESFDVRLEFDPYGGIQLDADYRGLRWERPDISLLTDEVRAALPPIEAAGRSSGTLKGAVSADPFALHDIEVDATLTRIEGAFGNLHTGEAKGLPYGLRYGRAHVTYRDQVLELSDCEAEYLPPEGEPGHLSATLSIDFGRVEPHVDFTLEGRAIRATTSDIRDLLAPEAAESIAEQFLPSGTFDFDVAMSSRPAMPNKIWATVRLSQCECEYAGRLDELTGRRFGFRYPLDRGAGTVRFETGIPTPRGQADLFELIDLRGYNKISSALPEGPADVRVKVDGTILSYHPGHGAPTDDIDVVIRVRDLPIDRKLTAAFASTPYGTPYEKFDLSGWADTLVIRIEQDAFEDPEPRSTYDVQLRDCSIAYEDFPLHLQNISGTIVSRDEGVDERGQTVRTLEFKGLHGVAAEGGVITADGVVRQTQQATETISLDIHVKDLLLGDDFVRALNIGAPGTRSDLPGLWKKLRPEGRVDAHLAFRSVGDVAIQVELAGQASLRGYEDMDLPIEGLSGFVQYDDGIITLKEIRGRAGGTPFLIEGKVLENGAFELHGAIHELHLHEPVRHLIAEIDPSCSEALSTLRIDNRSSLDVSVDLRRSGPGAPIESDARLEQLRLVTQAGPLEITVQGGPVEVTQDKLVAADLWLTAGEGQMHLHDVQIQRGETRRLRARIDARDLGAEEHLVHLFGEGVREILGRNLRIDLHGLQVDLDETDMTATLQGGIELRRHEVLDERTEALEPTGTLTLSPITVRLPETPGGPIRYNGVIEFDGLNLNLPVDARDMAGELLIADGTLSPQFTLKGAVSNGQVTVYDRYLDRLALNLTFRPEVVRLNNMDGRLYKGNFRGDVEVHLGEPGAFRVRLRATDVDLGEMLKEDMSRSDPMSGKLDAAIEFESASGETRHMQGRGEIRVREGQLIRVPGLRRILAVISRATPLEGPRFKRAEVDFQIEGEELDVQRFHLSTRLNDIHGSGRITIYGDLDLVVEPQVTRLIDLPRLINLPVLSTLRDLWRKAVYEIRLEGTIDSPTLRLRGLPWLRKREEPITQSPHAGKAERRRPRILPH